MADSENHRRGPFAKGRKRALPQDPMSPLPYALCPTADGFSKRPKLDIHDGTLDSGRQSENEMGSEGEMRSDQDDTLREIGCLTKAQRKGVRYYETQRADAILFRRVRLVIPSDGRVIILSGHLTQAPIKRKKKIKALVRYIWEYCGEQFYQTVSAIAMGTRPLQNTHTPVQIENGSYLIIEFTTHEQADTALRMIQEMPNPASEVNVRLSAVKFDDNMTWPTDLSKTKHHNQRNSYIRGRIKMATRLLGNGWMDIHNYPGFAVQPLDGYDAIYPLLDGPNNRGSLPADTVVVYGDGGPARENPGQLSKKAKKERARKMSKQETECERVEVANIQSTEISENEIDSLSIELSRDVYLEESLKEEELKDSDGAVMASDTFQAEPLSSDNADPHVVASFPNPGSAHETKSSNSLTSSLQVSPLDNGGASDLRDSHCVAITRQSNIGDVDNGVKSPPLNVTYLKDHLRNAQVNSSTTGTHMLLGTERPDPIISQTLYFGSGKQKHTKIMEEPVKLRHLPNNERELQTRYWGIVNDDDLVRCSTCSEEGHMIDHCPSRVCEHCRVARSHFSDACPSMQHLRKCCKCRERGHTLEQCTSKLSRSAVDGFSCDICTGNHVEEECSWIWRTFDPSKTKVLSQVDDLIVGCYECGSSQHWGDDCLSRERSKPIHCNTFSSSFANLFSRTPIIRVNPKDGIAIRGRAQQKTVQSDRALGELSNFYGRKVDTHRLPPKPMKVRLPPQNAVKTHYESSDYRGTIENNRYGTPSNQESSGHGLRISSSFSDSRAPNDQYHFTIPSARNDSRRPIDDARSRDARGGNSMQYAVIRPIDEARSRFARDNDPAQYGTRALFGGNGVGATSSRDYY